MSDELREQLARADEQFVEACRNLMGNPLLLSLVTVAATSPVLVTLVLWAVRRTPGGRP